MFSTLGFSRRTIVQGTARLFLCARGYARGGVGGVSRSPPGFSYARTLSTNLPPPRRRSRVRTVTRVCSHDSRERRRRLQRESNKGTRKMSLQRPLSPPSARKSIVNLDRGELKARGDGGGPRYARTPAHAHAHAHGHTRAHVFTHTRTRPHATATAAAAAKGHAHGRPIC